MILNSPENRKIVTEYLESVKEEKFIDEFVIPYFSSHGFYLYRKVDHTSGEHGKDLIFYRHVPMYYDNEYIVVQAKSEKVTTRNVEKFSSQTIRALKVPFPAKSGGYDQMPHYAVFMNSKRLTNDADLEFNKIAGQYQHIKILGQENVCELILKSGIGPKRLQKKLSKSTPDESSKEDMLVYETIMGNAPSEIDNLLDHKLKFIKQFVSENIRKLVIEYIYDRWQQDRSWEGTVKPMKWFDTYFDFINEDQYVYLIDVIEELTCSTPSFKARAYTASVVRKITPEITSSIAEQFIKACGKIADSTHREYRPLIVRKLKELQSSKLVKDSNLREMMETIRKFADEEYESNSEYEKLRKEILYFVHPKLAERLKGRRKKTKKKKI